MSVTIQDDMWRAAESMSGKQRDEFLLALLRYGFTGEELDESSKAFPFFILCKDRIELSAKRSNARGGNKPKGGFGSEPNHDFDSEPKRSGKAKSTQPDNRGEESRGENEERRDSGVGSEPNDERSAQVSEVIDHLNATCGTKYRPSSSTARKFVGARLEAGFTVEECKRVIDNMAARWLDSERMRPYLRPTTLFRKEKFESYLNLPAEPTADDDEWSAYDLGGGDDTDTA